MIRIEGTVERTELTLFRPIEPVTSGCRNSVSLHLSFSKSWETYSERYVEFRTPRGLVCREAVSHTGACVLPDAITEESGVVEVSVIGVCRQKNGADATVATERMTLAVARGAGEG